MPTRKGKRHVEVRDSTYDDLFKVKFDNQLRSVDDVVRKALEAYKKQGRLMV